jgi:hypothetical protein
MERSRFRRRLAFWAGIGVLLVGGTVLAGLYAGAGTAWSLGAILATVYSGTLIFVERAQDKTDRKGDGYETEAEQVGPGMMPPRKDPDMMSPGRDEHDAIRGVPGEVAVSSPPIWQEPGKNASYGWHPALNRIEDVLIAQVPDPSTIVDIIERAGLNPGIIPRGHGAAATLWHGALRRAWLNGREKKICELLRETYKREPSSELQSLIETCCGRQ